MTVPLSPFPSVVQLEKASIKNKRFREPLRNIIEALLESYKSGHKGSTKLAAYIKIQKELPFLDRALVEVFNKLAYGNRPTLDSTTENIPTV